MTTLGRRLLLESKTRMIMREEKGEGRVCRGNGARTESLWGKGKKCGETAWLRRKAWQYRARNFLV